MVGEEDASVLREENNPLTPQVFEAVRSALPETSDEEILAAIHKSSGPLATVDFNQVPAEGLKL